MDANCRASRAFSSNIYRGEMRERERRLEEGGREEVSEGGREGGWEGGTEGRREDGREGATESERDYGGKRNIQKRLDGMQEEKKKEEMLDMMKEQGV